MSATIVYTGTRPPTPPREPARIVHLPMLETRCLESRLITHLENLPNATPVLIFYSANAVRCVEAQLGSHLESLPDARYWAVGEATADAVSRRWQVQVHVPSRQNFEGLLEALRAVIAPTDCVISFELADSPRSLSQRELPCEVRSVAVYETVPSGADVAGCLAREAPSWIVFTSPRGFAAFAERAPHEWHRMARVAAIGPTTAGAIQKAGLQVDFVADDPDVAKLLCALAEQLPGGQDSL